MNFSDELRKVTINKKIEQQNARMNNKLESEFVEGLCELIKSQCMEVARKGQRSLACSLHTDSDSDYFLYPLRDKPLNEGLHPLCYGNFFTSESGFRYIRGNCKGDLIHEQEDDEFIVRQLKLKLHEMGFATTNVSLTYAPKREEHHHYKQTLFGANRRITDIVIHDKYYKLLIIKLSW